ncbi:MAG: NAD-dependent protein deacylase [Velocimicrobium sp.]
MKNTLDRVIEVLEHSNHMVFFGGAGVSTESGIPDFRGVDGLYHQQFKYEPETILSHHFFMKNKEEFFQFYWNKMICVEAKPNITHKKLAQLEKTGRLMAIITQNIDGLHQMAGSEHVEELHGCVNRNYCTSCGKPYSLEELLKRKEASETIYVPYCDCGGVIKPDVVLYEEGLNQEVVEQTIQYLSKADTLIIGGTSLSVYPAAGFIRYFSGKELILINKTKTPCDNQTDLVINCGLGEVFSKVMVDNL